MRSLYLILVYVSLAVAQVQEDHFVRELSRSTHAGRQEISHVLKRRGDDPRRFKPNPKNPRLMRSSSPPSQDHSMNGADSGSHSSPPRQQRSGSPKSVVREFSRSGLDSGSEMSIDSARSKSPRRSDPTSFEAQGRIPSITSSRAPTLRRLEAEDANASTPPSLRSNASSGKLNSAVAPRMRRYSPYPQRTPRERTSPVSSPMRSPSSSIRSGLRALRIDGENDVQSPATPIPKSSSHKSTELD